jgi:ABC-2 type transport system permease protein
MKMKNDFIRRIRVVPSVLCPPSCILKYFRVWRRLALMSFEVQTSEPLSSMGYLLGKLVRLGFFLLFLWAIFKQTRALAGYTLAEAALFFLTFNVIDILAQLFFRGIYSIRGLIREGDFDYFLIQPVNVLYRVAFKTVDFLDVVTILPVLAITVHVLRQIPGGTGARWILYLLLCANGILIALAIHIAVASLAVLTQELENTIWIYRDLMTLGRFPVDIYSRSVREVLTFVIPVAVMTSFPAKAFLGLLSWRWIAQAFMMSLLGLTASLLFWRFANRRYTSVSS